MNKSKIDILLKSKIFSNHSFFKLEPINRFDAIARYLFGADNLWLHAKHLISNMSTYCCPHICTIIHDWTYL